MSKEKVQAMKSENNNVVSVVPPAPENEKLSDIDRMNLELAKSKRQTALAEAKTALAQNENAELSYKYVVLQLYMKYGLTERDAISEAGEILKDGAVQQASNESERAS